MEEFEGFIERLTILYLKRKATLSSSTAGYSSQRLKLTKSFSTPCYYTKSDLTIISFFSCCLQISSSTENRFYVVWLTQGLFLGQKINHTIEQCQCLCHSFSQASRFSKCKSLYLSFLYRTYHECYQKAVFLVSSNIKQPFMCSSLLCIFAGVIQNMIYMNRYELV